MDLGIRLPNLIKPAGARAMVGIMTHLLPRWALLSAEVRESEIFATPNWHNNSRTLNASVYWRVSDVSSRYLLPCMPGLLPGIESVELTKMAIPKVSVLKHISSARLRCTSQIAAFRENLRVRAPCSCAMQLLLQWIPHSRTPTHTDPSSHSPCCCRCNGSRTRARQHTLTRLIIPRIGNFAGQRVACSWEESF